MSDETVPSRFPDPSPEVLKLLRAGKLEQSCPDCGRWSAASRCCSWCFRPMGPNDWYADRDLTERRARRPSRPPANPPCEDLVSRLHWHRKWPAFNYPGKTPPQ